MPSPIVHTAAGYLIYRFSRGRLSQGGEERWGPMPIMLVAAVIFAMLPDGDAFVGLLAGNMSTYHNNGTHSLVVGLAVSLLVAALLRLGARAHFWSWFVILLASYESHVILDYFTFGSRGVMLFWPLSAERFIGPITMFYGVRYSEGLASPEHILTLASELLLVMLVLGGVWLADWRKSRQAGQTAQGAHTAQSRAKG